MVTFLSGGTGTPKLLTGVDDIIEPEAVTVVTNTGDDVDIGGLFVSPDVDTVLFERSGLLDRDTWWGIEGDSHEAEEMLRKLGGHDRPQYLPAEEQTDGRPLSKWRRFGVDGLFLTLGDRDRAIHTLRSHLLDRGHSLEEVIQELSDRLEIECAVRPMSNDPVATICHTEEGAMHFQEYWVHHRAEPTVTDIEYRGSDSAGIPASVETALEDPVVIGPANPVTSIGPMLAIDGFETALEETTVVAISPFVEDTVFSGPAGILMADLGIEASTRGVAEMYPFVDAFVLDSADETALDRPIVKTDTSIDGPADAITILEAVDDALDRVGSGLEPNP